MPRGWRVLGGTFSLECPDEAARSCFDRLFAGLPRAAHAEPVRITRTDHGWCMTAAGEPYASGTFAAVVDALVGHLRDLAVRSVDDRTALLHAAAVAFEGTAVLLPGPSGSGKSSLAVAVAHRPGWELLGDEIVGLTPDGQVLPCPLPPRLGRTARQLLDLAEPTVPGKRYVGLEREPCAERYPLGAIVFPRYASTSATVLTPKARAEAVAELSTQMFPLPLQVGLDLAVDAAGGTPLHDLPYGDLFSAAELVCSIAP